MIKQVTIVPADLADEEWVRQETAYKQAQQDLEDYHAWLEDQRIEEILELTPKFF